MANQRVTLMRRCKTEKGWGHHNVAMQRGGRVRHQYIVLDKEQRGPYPEGYYELRYYEKSKVVYRNVGEDPAGAVIAREAEIKQRALMGLSKVEDQLQVVLAPGKDIVERLMASDRVLSTDDVAYLLDVARKTILRRVQMGTLPYFRIGSAIKFRPASIAKFIEEEEEKARNWTPKGMPTL